VSSKVIIPGFLSARNNLSGFRIKHDKHLKDLKNTLEFRGLFCNAVVKAKKELYCTVIISFPCVSAPTPPWDARKK